MHPLLHRVTVSRSPVVQFASVCKKWRFNTSLQSLQHPIIDCIIAVTGIFPRMPCAGSPKILHRQCCDNPAPYHLQAKQEVTSCSWRRSNSVRHTACDSDLHERLVSRAVQTASVPANSKRAVLVEQAQGRLRARHRAGQLSIQAMPWQILAEVHAEQRTCHQCSAGHMDGSSDAGCAGHTQQCSEPLVYLKPVS